MEVPLAVALAESVIWLALLIALIVVPAGIPVPDTPSPTERPAVLLTLVTVGEPFVSVPVNAGMPELLTV